MNFLKQRNWIIAVLLLTAVIFSGCNNGLMGSTDSQGSSFNVTRSAALASANEDTFAIMAPLHYGDYGEMSEADFESHLATAASYGVQAISVDVWWGLVESSDGVYDWSYYDKTFEKIVDAGMKIVPIMSFHKCGGGPGDYYEKDIPNWVWSISGVEMFKDENNRYYDDYVSIWSEGTIINEYRDFMNAFEYNFDEYAASGNFMEINISAGPTGELRYPSYNRFHNNTEIWKYPYRGFLVAYSAKAIEDFQNSIMAQYGNNISSINAAWLQNIYSKSDIQPPSNPDDFFKSGYNDTEYKKDFLNWYNQSLVDHGSLIIDTARSAFNDPDFEKIPLGMKIPGIHWQIHNSSNISRSAEQSAGLLPYDTSNSNGNGYDPIVEMIAAKDNSGSNYDGIDDIILHFTCLEMDDDPFKVENGQTTYSLAKSLVGYVAESAEVNNVRIKGENALWGGITWYGGWDNIDNAYSSHIYEGFTGLRLWLKYDENGVSKVRTPLTDGSYGQTRYTSFISSYNSTTAPNSANSINATPESGAVTVSWNSVPGATSYKVYYSSGNSTVDLGSVSTISTTSNSIKVNNLINGTNYNFKVLAMNSIGLSGLSAAVSATPNQGTFKTNLGSGTILTLTGEEFENWDPDNTTYEFKLVADYTWEVSIPNKGGLNNTQYKIVKDGSWSINWGGNAGGLNTSLNRSGGNAKVSLNPVGYTLKVTEGSNVNDALHVQWIPDSQVTTTVTFKAGNGYTYLGQSMYVIGSIPELGNWDIANAVRMYPEDINGNNTYPTWEITIDVPANTYIEWKLIKREENNPNVYEWTNEPGNKSFTSPLTGNTVQTATFQ